MLTKKQTGVIFLTFCISVAATCLLAAALGTDFWVVSSPRREVEQLGVNVRSSESEDKFRGTLNLGLFRGHKVFDSGFGTSGRPTDVNVVTTYVEKGVFNYGLWMCTVVFVSLGILWGFISAVFSMLNSTVKPKSAVIGPFGLYLWNGIACFLTLVAVVMFVGLYYKDLKENVLSISDRQNLWTSADRSRFGMSFWFAVAASIGFALNVILILIAGVQVKPFSKKPGGRPEKNQGDTIIMY